MPTRDLDRLDRTLDERPGYRRVVEESAPWEAIADRLIAYRVEHGISQTELARRCQTTQSAIARLEAGEHVPRLDTLAKVVHALGGELYLGVLDEGRGLRELAVI